MSNQVVALNEVAIRGEIERQIEQVGSNKYSMSYNQNLITAIESIKESNIKGELLHKFLDALTAHQSEQNSALRSEVISRIKINEAFANNIIEKDKARTSLFNSRPLIVFAWCFPVFVGFAAIKFLESMAFAFFMVIVLYGVLISLYFSQENGLAATWEAFTKKQERL